MAIIFRFSLILSVLVFCSVCTDNARAEVKTVVHFKSYMPKGSAPVNVDCKAVYVPVLSHSLKAGEDYKWTPTVNLIHDCEARWAGKIATWVGFDPNRDNKHTKVFWKINDKGVYLRLDNSTWKLVEKWKIE